MKTIVSLACLTAAVTLAGCGSDSRNATPATPDGRDSGPNDSGSSNLPADGSVYSGCNAHTCKDGCCKNGQCVQGEAPSQCGGGGLACVDCTVYKLGCVNRGCGVATCPGCDGCCLAGTCNTNGKSQDNACGKSGEVCTDCTSSGRTCNGLGSCI